MIGHSSTSGSVLKLVVLLLFKVIESPSPTRVTVGNSSVTSTLTPSINKSVELQCFNKNAFTHKEWYTTGSEVNPTSNEITTKSGNTRILAFSSFAPRHAGTYTCLASSSGDTQTKTTYAVILVNPSAINAITVGRTDDPATPITITPTLSQPIKLECERNGTGIGKNWFTDGNKTVANTFGSLCNIGGRTIIISTFSSIHTSTYTCNVNNTEYPVILETPPPPPSIPKPTKVKNITITDSGETLQLNVSWIPPSGEDLKNYLYVVMYSTKRGNKTDPPSDAMKRSGIKDTYTILTGLQSNATYYVWVAAEILGARVQGEYRRTSFEGVSVSSKFTSSQSSSQVLQTPFPSDGCPRIFMFTETMIGKNQSIQCSSLSPNNLYGGTITIECLKSGMWGTLDISQCTFKKDSKINGLLLVEVTNESEELYPNHTINGSSYSIIVVEDSEVNSCEILTNLSNKGFNGSIILMNKSDCCSCCETNSISLSKPLVKSYSICNGSIKSQSACTCANETNKCNSYYTTTNDRMCTLDEDEDGIPDYKDECIGCCFEDCDCSGSFGCTCISPFTMDESGDCEIPKCSVAEMNTRKCRAEKDKVWKIDWPCAGHNISVYAECPSRGMSKTIGKASRKCQNNGDWEPADVSQCESKEFKDIGNQISNLINQLNNSLSEENRTLVKNLTGALSGVTAPQNTTESILPKDMETVVNVLNGISNLSSDYNLFNPESFNESIETASNVGNVISNILEENNKPAFNQNMKSAEEKSLSDSILESTEEMATGIAQIWTKANNPLITPNFGLEGNRINTTNISSPVMSHGDFEGFRNKELIPRITIPQSFIQKVAEEEDTVIVVNFVMNNIEELLPLHISKEEKHNFPGNATIVPASLVVSSQIQGFKNPSVSKADEKVQIDFDLKNTIYAIQVPDGMKLEYTCVFWDFGANGGSGGWSTKGVKLSKRIFNETTKRTQVTCESTHLTSFVVLVSVTDEAPTSTLGFNVLTYIGCGISLICLLLSIIFFLSLRKELIKKVHNYVHLNLCIALTFGLIIFLAGIDTATAVPIACKVVSALMHYFFLSVFTWSLCEGVLIYNLLVKVFKANDKKWIYIYTALGWGLPIPIVVVSASIRHEYYFRRVSFDADHENSTYDIQACWLPPHLGLIWAFVGPMILIVLVDAVLLIISVVSLHCTKRKTAKLVLGRQPFIKLGMQLLKTVVILLPLFCFTWIIGLFAVAPEAQVFAYIFIVSNTLQGLFIFLLHVVRNEKFWGKIKKCLLKRRVKARNKATPIKGKDSENNNEDEDLEIKLKNVNNAANKIASYSAEQTLVSVQ